MRYYHPFPEAIPHSEAGSSRVTHPSATKIKTEALISVRLACVKRAASVRPEPGSNSLKKLYIKRFYPFSIDPKASRSLRSQLPFTSLSDAPRFLFLSRLDSLKGLYFFKFLKTSSIQTSRACSIVVHCSIFKIPAAVNFSLKSSGFILLFSSRKFSFPFL